MHSSAAFNFQRGRSVFLRGFGNALPIASRTIRRCTPSFFAAPAIVPTPNSYSRRICLNKSTCLSSTASSSASGCAEIDSHGNAAGIASEIVDAKLDADATNFSQAPISSYTRIA